MQKNIDALKLAGIMESDEEATELMYKGALLKQLNSLKIWIESNGLSQPWAADISHKLEQMIASLGEETTNPAQ